MVIRKWDYREGMLIRNYPQRARNASPELLQHRKIVKKILNTARLKLHVGHALKAETRLTKM